MSYAIYDVNGWVCDFATNSGLDALNSNVDKSNRNVMGFLDNGAALITDELVSEVANFNTSDSFVNDTIEILRKALDKSETCVIINDGLEQDLSKKDIDVTDVHLTKSGVRVPKMLIGWVLKQTEFVCTWTWDSVAPNEFKKKKLKGKEVEYTHPSLKGSVLVKEGAAEFFSSVEKKALSNIMFKESANELIVKSVSGFKNATQSGSLADLYAGLVHHAKDIGKKRVVFESANPVLGVPCERSLKGVLVKHFDSAGNLIKDEDIVKALKNSGYKTSKPLSHPAFKSVDDLLLYRVNDKFFKQIDKLGYKVGKGKAKRIRTQIDLGKKPVVEPISPKPTARPKPVEAPAAEWRHLPDTQLGSNPGGMFIGPDGKKYYAKFYENYGQASTEYFSHNLMDELGFKAPVAKLEELPWKGKKVKALVTEWIDETPLSYVEGFDIKSLPLKQQKEIAKHYLAASLNANWDVVGAAFDNLVSYRGRWVCIDQGGSLAFRAKGGYKVFGHEVAELDTFLKPGRKAAQMFQPVIELIEKKPDEYIEWLKGLSNSKISRLAKISDLGTETDTIVDILKGRRDNIITHLEAMRPVKGRKIKGGKALFKDKKLQAKYEQYYNEYSKMSFVDDESYKFVFRKECGELCNFLSEWQGNTMSTGATSLKVLAERVENKPALKARTGHISKQNIDRIEDLLDDQAVINEYLKGRALTQVYYANNKQKSVKLYRGFGGRTGDKIRDVTRVIKGESIKDFWVGRTVEIQRDALDGWTSSRVTADKFGMSNKGTTVISNVPVEDIVFSDNVWHKTSYHLEREFILRGGKTSYAVTEIDIEGYDLKSIHLEQI